MDRLLTDEEIQVAVAIWVAEDSSTRSVSLNRGHWEDIAPVIAQAQRQLTLKAVGEWLDDPCPHGTLAADTSPASRRECSECWQTFLRGEFGARGEA